MKPDGGKKVNRTGEGLLIMPKWCTVILLCLARGPHKSAAAMLNDENHGVCVWPETRNVTRKIKLRIQWASRRAVLFENNLCLPAGPLEKARTSLLRRRREERAKQGEIYLSGFWNLLL